ncbi:hypothetical protein LDENG_00178960 [Lucifuga dentata]|nr:hypothetical protein LDENG_00178960 [Lucifuga dentata]
MCVCACVCVFFSLQRATISNIQTEEEIPAVQGTKEKEEASHWQTSCQSVQRRGNGFTQEPIRRRE